MPNARCLHLSIKLTDKSLFQLYKKDLVIFLSYLSFILHRFADLYVHLLYGP